LQPSKRKSVRLLRRLPSKEKQKANESFDAPNMSQESVKKLRYCLAQQIKHYMEDNNIRALKSVFEGNIESGV